MRLVSFSLWKVPKDSSADTVCNALRSGYRLFDGVYECQNEKEAGEDIKRAISEGLVKREEVFITTKLQLPRQRALAAKDQGTKRVFGPRIHRSFVDPLPFCARVRRYGGEAVSWVVDGRL
jgi:diketogulonate reductase-like aldo/keto reductase